MNTPAPHTVTATQAGQTLAAILRSLLPGESWSQARALATGRRVAVGGSLCMDPARRLKEGEVVEVLAKPAPVVRGERPDDVVIRHLDDDIVVVEKASGISTVRHPAEREWKDNRRELVPTLDDITQQAIATRSGKKKHQLPRLRVVHRLDKETSGLVTRSSGDTWPSCRATSARKRSRPGWSGTAVTAAAVAPRRKRVVSTR
jgi:23S rRNA pseudouridine1911/1915/1917 synthase